MAANARLLKSFPKGFSLDETHHPHVSMLQQFVRTDDLDKVFAAANAVLAKSKPTTSDAEGVQVLLHLRLLRESSSNRLKTCIGCKMRSSKRSNPTS